MTYNYILNPKIRKKIKIFEENSIVILDEAHNICNILENLYSRKISINELEKMQTLLQIILDFNNMNKYKISSKNSLLFLDAKDINDEINTIKKYINKILDFESQNNIYICDFVFFKEIFKDFKLKFYSELTENIAVLDNEYESELNNFVSREYNENINLSSLFKLTFKIFQFLQLINEISNIQNKEEDLEKDKLKQEEIDKEKELYMNSFRFIFSSEKEKFFQIVCLDASYGLDQYLKIKPYSTILTSGTLSIDLIENLLKIKFTEKLRNSNVISKNQFCMNIIKGYSMDNKMNIYSFNYNNRNNKNQITSLGKEIYNFVKSVKIGGVLVFFQSYDYLEKCHTAWLESKTIQKFESIKKVLFDSYNNRKYNEDFVKKNKKNNNLLLFTVYRGRTSEGINFYDDEVRMVICIGVPFPNLSDIRVKLKTDYLDKKSKIEKNNFNGWNWSKEEAINTVNQSLGRLIRHKNDYGIMICFGIEFSKYGIQFSKWINDNISKESYIILKENDINYFNGLNTFLTNLNNKKIINEYEYEYSDPSNEIEDYEFMDDYNLMNDIYSEESWEKEKDIYKYNIGANNSNSKENDYKNYGMNHIGYKRYREKYDSYDNSED